MGRVERGCEGGVESPHTKGCLGSCFSGACSGNESAKQTKTSAWFPVFEVCRKFS